MKLEFNQIKEAVSGVAYCEEADGKVIFHRFSEKQEEYYNRVAPGFSHKLLATAGVCLRFLTDSPSLSLAVETRPGSTRTYFSHDILVNGAYLGSLSNFSDGDMTGLYPQKEFPLGVYEKSFSTGAGEKEITILFPALVCSSVLSVELADGSSFTPSPERKTLLALGDSITQGYDCVSPRNRYTSIIAARLGLSEHNLAIGGDVFRGEAAEGIKEDASLIIVAYGSNDWHGRGWDEARADCEKYFENLSANIPGVPVFVISPIWRKDWQEVRPYGEFGRVEELLGSICGRNECFTLVRGFGFVPHDSSFFGDGVLHPNDRGFDCYAKSFFSESGI